MSAQADPLQRERPRLFALAYRMLGSVGEAEDVVQEAYLRWYSQPREEVRNPPGFLTTVVTHLCLDELKSARRQREHYPGVWLPEPVADDTLAEAVTAPVAAGTPEQDVERLESISLAFLSLLDTLGPLERAVFVLAEVFDYPHAEVAAIVGRTPEACRKALSRAKQNLAAGKPAAASADRHRELLLSFIDAVRRGHVDELARLLADDVESRADGGGYVTAATKPVVGVRAVSRLYVGLSSQIPPDLVVRVETVNGGPAALLSVGDVLLSVMQVSLAGDRIRRIDNVMNPHKLARIAAARGMKTLASSQHGGQAELAHPTSKPPA
jgi:RNA polymerase sigma-70 factor, ECF subfamily